ncbi:Uncharacterized protein TCM_045894 [Theobroma cacao]|uniref:Uncharacterized protein n=1 Tax=Theobroma cacao TaxID=3641 RepID=S1SI53_THECC|nr:Uncharacterized protein TCM_045894 [Theobroma cacao]
MMMVGIDHYPPKWGGTTQRLWVKLIYHSNSALGILDSEDQITTCLDRINQCHGDMIHSSFLVGDLVATCSLEVELSSADKLVSIYVMFMDIEHVYDDVANV